MTSTYRITAASVRDFKRVKSVKITPSADRSIILIAGKNAQGKSSLIDALTVAIGGKRSLPADPVRHGADSSEIIVELTSSEDALVIKRNIEKDGSSTLEIRDRDGAPLRAPQERLNALIGVRFLDPIQFLQLDAVKQRALLLSIIDKDGAIEKLDERRDRLYDKRTEVGRDLTRAKGELGRLPPRSEAGTPIDVAALSAEREQIAEQQRVGDSLSTEHRDAATEKKHQESELARCRATIADLERKLAEWRATETKIGDALATAAAAEVTAAGKLEAARNAWAGATARRQELDADLKRADEHNRKVYETQTANARRVAADDTIKQLEERTAEQSKMIQKIEDEKLAILAATKLPVDGLGIEKGGIALNGVPFAQASAAERMRVALALAMVSSPGLDDVWVRDGALLDSDSLAACAAFADSAGKRLWIERVGDQDAGAIIIQDGAVRE